MTVPPMSLSPEPRRMAGSEIGILMLDTRFPRPLGDIGNPASFAFPVRYHRVAGATPARVVTQAQRARALLPDFISGARALERAGVAAITTSCGFLGPVQQDLAAAVSVPVLTSPLFLLPLARLSCGNRPVGVVTAHAGHLSAEHLSACGIDPRWDVPVIGLEHAPAFRDAILGNASDRIRTGSRPRSWPPAAPCRCGGPIWARWSSNAPTCRPIAPRCAGRPGLGCLTAMI